MNAGESLCAFNVGPRVLNEGDGQKLWRLGCEIVHLIGHPVASATAPDALVRARSDAPEGRAGFHLRRLGPCRADTQNSVALRCVARGGHHCAAMVDERLRQFRSRTRSDDQKREVMEYLDWYRELEDSATR